MQGVKIIGPLFIVQNVGDKDTGLPTHYVFDVPPKDDLEELIWSSSVPYEENGEVTGYIHNIGNILEYVYQKVYGAGSQDDSPVPTCWWSVKGTSPKAA